jgi:hypothetical protein
MIFTRSLLITKLKATAVHLSMSLAVFIFLAYQIYYNWYPEPYFTVDGGLQGFKLVGVIDLVLGPLITFLIFDLRKSRREILFDLIIILVIQFGALGYGVYATYTQRPVAVIVIADLVIPATMEQYGSLIESASELQRYSDEKPPIIYSDYSLTGDKMGDVEQIRKEHNALEHAQTQLYWPQSKFPEVLKKRQLSAIGILENSGPKQAYTDWLQQNGKTAEEILLLRFEGRYGMAWLVFDLEGKLIGYF